MAELLMPNPKPSDILFCEVVDLIEQLSSQGRKPKIKNGKRSSAEMKKLKSKLTKIVNGGPIPKETL